MIEEKKSAHAFASTGRKGIDVSGVLSVVSFDEGGALMETDCGSLAVEGEELHVTTLELSSGRVRIEGRISAVYYFDALPVKKKGLFGRKNA